MLDKEVFWRVSESQGRGLSLISSSWMMCLYLVMTCTWNGVNTMTFLLYSAGISSNKSNFISLAGRASHRIYGLFPFRATTMEEGLKYLGFNLKPNCYCKSDWYWLLERIEQRIGKWSYK